MAGWTIEMTGSWLLDWLIPQPQTQIGGLGVIVQESITGKDGPPWNLIKTATESLMLSGIIDAIREYTFGSVPPGTPAFYQSVKFTPGGLKKLTSQREEIGFQ